MNDRDIESDILPKLEPFDSAPLRSSLSANEFSSAAIDELSGLGVESYESAALERAIIDAAIRQQEDRDAAELESRVTNSSKISIPRIPKKSLNSSASPHSSSTGFSFGQQIHFDDPIVRGKSFIGKRKRSDQTPSHDNSSSTQSAAADYSSNSANRSRELLISSGSITPFANIQGKEKNFTRIRINEKNSTESAKQFTGDEKSASPHSITQPQSQPQSRPRLGSREIFKNPLPSHSKSKQKRIRSDGQLEESESDEISGSNSADSDSDWRSPVASRKKKQNSSRKRNNSQVESKSDSEESAISDDDLADPADDDADSDALDSSAARRSLLVDDFEDSRYFDRVESVTSGASYQLELSSSLDVAFDGGFQVPGRVWDRLFSYQKTSIKWLWELHCQNTGGIIADEMGLGKTIQLVAFLAGLHFTHQNDPILSKTRPLPHLIVCPATILTQWLREFHDWFPALRVFVFHDSVPHAASKPEIIDKLFRCGHVLLTTYETVRRCKHLLLSREWNYVLLDEGAKIRNPDAEITLVCKQFLSIHRIILSGSPIQNNLVELWSLMDFVFPGKLGTLPVFEDEFCYPINAGGFIHASQAQVQLAYKCALLLRDLINPYILRRTKADVAQHLPKKTERVLFCNLTDKQRQIYKEFLRSEIVQSTIDGKGSLFKAIGMLRKLCNHPDLIELVKSGGPKSNKKIRPSAETIPDFGSVERSGKMKVLQEILKMWKAEGQKVLLFTQTRQMLDILESFVAVHRYSYRRIDGSTPIASRMPMIDQFNSDQNIFLMLLTTRAGGLGVNLTGANRVILFDPDWNPAVDDQAAERAFRISQLRNVTVYRLITRGTIEEKVYQRQIFKQFLTDKILKNPKQKRFFSSRDMKDLFILTDKQSGISETGAIFRSANEFSKEDAMREEKIRKQKIEAEQKMKEKEKEIIQIDDEFEEGEIVDSKAPPPVNALTSATANRVSGVNSGKLAEKLFEVADYIAPKSDSNSSASDENRILKMLFSKGAGLQSSIDHEEIIDSSRISSSANPRLADSAAQKVADRAVEALRASRAAMANQSIAEPTWTGRSGTKPTNERKRFGEINRSAIQSRETSSNSSAAQNSSSRPVRVYSDPDNSTSIGKHFDHSTAGFNRAIEPPSSNSLIQKMRERQAKINQSANNGFENSGIGQFAAASATAADSHSAADSSSSPVSSSRSSDLLVSLISYLSPGARFSDDLITHFEPELNSEPEKFLFRQLLRKVARLDKYTKKWNLKQEFQ